MTWLSAAQRSLARECAADVLRLGMSRSSNSVFASKVSSSWSPPGSCGGRATSERIRRGASAGGLIVVSRETVAALRGSMGTGAPAAAR